VYCAVGTEFLYKRDTVRLLKVNLVSKSRITATGFFNFSNYFN